MKTKDLSSANTLDLRQVFLGTGKRCSKTSEVLPCIAECVSKVTPFWIHQYVSNDKSQFIVQPRVFVHLMD